MFSKFIDGYVIQHFDGNGKCISQEFIADNDAEWEDDIGNIIGCPNDSWYYPFTMEQPESNLTFNILWYD